MLDWLKAAGIIIALWIALELAQFIFAPGLRPVGRAFSRLYAPPHGRWVLFATWALAVIGIWTGWSADSDRRVLGIVSMLVVPTIAMFATLAFRDERRGSLGLPPAAIEVPARLGIFSRIVLGAGSAVALGSGVFGAIAGGWSAWEGVAALLLLAVVLGYAAATGRFPVLFLMFLGAREREL
jgi:hypothetical protein